MINTMAMNIKGHVVIRCLDTQEILVDQHNDIHLKNFGEALALSISNFASGFIEEMHFGSGGSIINTTGSIDYLETNVSDTPDQADLHGAGGFTFAKVVNNRSANFIDDSVKTNIKVYPNNLNQYTDIVVTCTLDYGEPAGQAAFDNATAIDAPFIFDELALKTVDMATNKKRMLTHVIFHPVQKALNRAIEIIYTLRITMLS